ncbi:MAG: FecR family protein [Marinifilaceae bacterium]
MKNQLPNSVDWEAISRYLSGEMDEAEHTAFEEKLTKDSAYAKIVANSKKDWKAIEQMHNVDEQVDTDSAWNGLLQRFEQDGLLPQPAKTTRRELPNTRQWLASVFARPLVRVAASIILVLGLGLTAYQVIQTVEFQQNVQTAYSEGGKTILLSDGSKIQLNGNSTFSYPRTFKGKVRKVKLTGEAFFEIARNPEKPFIIEAENAQIKVLGTTFNVNTFDRNVEVFVKSGKVEVSALKNPASNLILEKGDFARVVDSRVHQETLEDENYLAWKTRHMVFRETSLEEVAKVLNRSFQVQIHFEDSSLRKLPLNSTFERKDSLEAILEYLSISHQLQYRREGANIWFSKQ